MATFLFIRISPGILPIPSFISLNFVYFCIIISMIFNNYTEFNLAKEQCKSCEIGKIYNRVVLSDGNTMNPNVMVVGEAAGSSEVEVGKPFVGKAGKLLRATLNEFGFRKSNSLITNVIPCRPQDNKFPMDNQLILNCFNKWLRQEIIITKPKFILLIGAKSVKYILNMNGITKIRGKFVEHEIEGLKIMCMPTLHPSYVLRKEYMEEGKIIKQQFRDDIKKVAIASGLIEEK